MHIEWTEWFGAESAENIRYVEFMLDELTSVFTGIEKDIQVN